MSPKRWIALALTLALGSTGNAQEPATLGTPVSSLPSLSFQITPVARFGIPVPALPVSPLQTAVFGNPDFGDRPSTVIKAQLLEPAPTAEPPVIEFPAGSLPLPGPAPALDFVPLGAGTLEPASRPQRLTTITAPPRELPRLGPTPPEDVGLLMGGTGLGGWLRGHGLRLYGWADLGYTYSSAGPGLLATEPRPNRFGNELLVNQLAVVLDRPLDPTQLSWGFNATYYAGADAALLQPAGGLDSPPGNPRFSQDFRQLYASAHLPILTEGGIDVKVGRMGTVLGYNSALAPYRPLYSSDYQWFYAQDSAWTGFMTDWYVSPQLHIFNGMSLGANTFFTTRSHDSYSYIGQVNYWLQPEKRTLLTASVQTGRDAVLAAPGFGGAYDTIVELRVQQNWSAVLTQVLQSNMGWSSSAPDVPAFISSRGEWYGLYTILILHYNPSVDLLTRAEWFNDVHGTRTGVATAFEEVTVGLDIHPVPWMSIRPEVRGDFAGRPAFGPGGAHLNRSQLTSAIDLLLKF
jgi:hypothetical protein